MLCAILFLLTWVIHSHTYRHHSKSLRWTCSPLLYENTHLLWHHFPAFSQRGREWWEWCSFSTSGLVWRVERVALLIKHYPFSVSHCGHYWQALDLELERNLTGVPVIPRLDTYSRCVFACVCVWKRRWPRVSLISAGQSLAHTAPPIPAPVHLSCRCFLSGWAKTFYLNLLRVPLKGLCYCSEPSCVCVTWESSAGWPSPNTLVHPYTHTHTSGSV